MQLIGSILFTLYFVLSALVWSVVVACLGLVVPYRRRFHAVQAWARSVMGALRITCGMTFEVEGAHNFPADTAVVVLQKHSSAWETVAGCLYCPPHTWVLKRELMLIPVLGFALLALRVIPINRKGRRTAINQVIDRGSERLEQGINVMIYPEGTRVEPGRNGRFGRSGSFLATKAGVPIVPIAHNAGDFWGRQSLIKHRGHVKVVIGRPIETKGRTAEQVNDEAARWLDETMVRISDLHRANGELEHSM